jgi:hypothetical protein
VLLAPLELAGLVELHDVAVDPGAHITLGAEAVEDLEMLALARLDDGREQHQAIAFRQGQHVVDHLADGLRFQRDAVIGTAGLAGTGEQQAKIVVDLGDSAHGRAGIVGRGLLLDGDRRRQALDVIHIGLL